MMDLGRRAQLYLLDVKLYLLRYVYGKATEQTNEEYWGFSHHAIVHATRLAHVLKNS